MPTQNAAQYRLKPRVVAPIRERIQVRLTIDSRFTQYNFEQFFSVFKIRRRNALAEHLIMNFKSKTAQAGLHDFSALRRNL